MCLPLVGDDQRRLMYKIMDAFEKAIEKDLKEIVLDDSRLEFIQKCNSKAKFEPNSLSMEVERLIDKIKEVEVEVKK